MYTVCGYDDFCMDDYVIFTGTLEECQTYLADLEFDEYDDPVWIVAPDGFTIIE